MSVTVTRVSSGDVGGFMVEVSDEEVFVTDDDSVKLFKALYAMLVAHDLVPQMKSKSPSKKRRGKT